MGENLSFVAIDFETANRSMASVCQVGITLVINGRVQRTESWYVIPPTGIESFDPFNTGIHGITSETVIQNQGLTWRDSLDCIHQFVQDRPLVAHNARFDQDVFISATQYIGAAARDYAWFDTLWLSRQRFPALTDHKLPTVASHLGIPFEHHHDAGADARAAAEIVLAVASRQGGGITDIFPGKSKNPTVRNIPSYGGYGRASTARVNELPEPRQEADPNHPLYGHHVVLTGGLGWIARWNAFELLAWCGAQPQKDITKKTTILVIAGAKNVSEDYLLTGSSSKERKALEYRAKGQEIRAITGGCLKSWTTSDLAQLNDHKRQKLMGLPGTAKKPQPPSPEEPASVDAIVTTAIINDEPSPSEAGASIESQIPGAEPTSSNDKFPPASTESEIPSQKDLVPSPTGQVDKIQTTRHSKQAPSTAEASESVPESRAWPAPARPRRVILARTGAVISVPLFGIALLLLIATLSVFPSQIARAGGDGAKLAGTMIAMLIFLMICGAIGSLGLWLLLRCKKHRRH